MLLEDIVQRMTPELTGKKVKDAIIGLSIIAVQLDSDEVGSSYVLKEELSGGCSIFPKGLDVRGLDALEVAQWAAYDRNILKRALGIATLNACCKKHYQEMVNRQDSNYMQDIKETDIIGMIGFIGPVIQALRGKTKDFIIFDKGRPPGKGIYEQELQPTLLPTCDIVFISGTAFINHSIDQVLQYCTKARGIIIIGSSTIVYPEAYHDSGITVLAGSFWKNECKQDIFQTISMAGGVMNLLPYMEKVEVRV